jgi:hypothetical protein
MYGRLGGPQDQSGRVQKISPTTGIRSPDRPACSESVYRLRYPAPFLDRFWKNSHITFDKNPSSGRRIVPCGRREGIHPRIWTSCLWTRTGQNFGVVERSLGNADVDMHSVSRIEAWSCSIKVSIWRGPAIVAPRLTCVIFRMKLLSVVIFP